MNETLDNYTTGGFEFRTRGEPLIIAALGRALWNFLNLEQIVVSIAYEARKDYKLVRGMMAGRKIMQLELIQKELEGMQAGRPVAELLQRAIEAFRLANSNYRNAISHAKPYIYLDNESGTFLSGLTLHIENSVVNIGNPDDLLEIAAKIEDAITPLSSALMAVKIYMKSFGKERQSFENQ